jgi:hypothetical protein
MVFPLVIFSSPGLAPRMRQGMWKQMSLDEPKKEPAEEAAPADGTPAARCVMGNSARSRRWQLGLTITQSSRARKGDVCLI